jgi:epoxyqueuosine reductase
VCQDVCPHNHGSDARPFQPALGVREALRHADLLRWLELGAADYRKLVKRSALRRVGKRQLQRNAAVALGNAGDGRAIGPLVRVLGKDPSALVREHAAWALGRLGGPEAQEALERAASTDPDETVRNEARSWL